MSAAAPSSAHPPSIFTHTRRLRDAIALINSLPPKRTAVLLARILTHLKDRTSAAFTSDELAQLTSVFSLSLDAINTILDALSYLVEQAAYHSLSAEKLSKQLLEVLHFSEAHSTAFVKVWSEQRDAYLNSLRERTFGLPLVLDCVQTRSGVTMATDKREKRMDIHTILSLGLKYAGEETQQTSAADGSATMTSADSFVRQPHPTICVELTPEAAQQMYEKLEQIQAQLDALSEKPQ